MTGISNAMSRRNLKISDAQNTNELSSKLSPGRFHVLNSASKDVKLPVEKGLSKSCDLLMGVASNVVYDWSKQPSKRRGAVKLSNRICKGQRSSTSVASQEEKYNNKFKHINFRAQENSLTQNHFLKMSSQFWSGKILY